MAAAGGDEAGGGEEIAAGNEVAPGRGIVAVGALVTAAIEGLEGAGFDISEDFRPDMNAFTNRERVCIGTGFLGTGEHMQPAKDDLCTAEAIPLGEFIGAAGEGEMNGDGNDFGERVGWGRPLKEIFIPITDVPMGWSGSGDARESQ